MNSLVAFLPMILASVATQERSFATAELVKLLSAENERVKAGLGSDQIAQVVNGIVQLAFAEQNALVLLLTSKLAAK